MAKTQIAQDLQAVFERDPAATSRLEVFFTYSGFHALLAYRISHWLWNRKVPFFPRLISQITRWLTGVEIHPGAIIGTGFFEIMLKDYDKPKLIENLVKIHAVAIGPFTADELKNFNVKNIVSEVHTVQGSFDTLKEILLQ